MKITISNLVKTYRKAKSTRSFKFPHVRKVTPSLVSQQIVSVQPMTLPTGLLFYLDYSYGSGSKEPKNE